jgi:hypothetical protein
MIEHEKALAAQQQRTEHKKVRSFSILPLCSFDSKYVTVDTTVMHFLVKHIAKRTKGPKPFKLRNYLDSSELTEPSSLISARRREAREEMRGAPASWC